MNSKQHENSKFIKVVDLIILLQVQVYKLTNLIHKDTQKITTLSKLTI